jgi:hypothetical protein
MKMFFRSILFCVIHWLGSDIHDVRTGQRIGRALLIPWRGRILVLGTGLALVPQFYPQIRPTFWKCELGFTRYPEPDFPHEPRA